VSKKILRKKLINLRKYYFSNKFISFSQFKKILNKFNIKKKQYIGGYYPINCEIDSLKILEKLEKNKFKISLPVIKKNNVMEFYEWSTKTSLKVSRQGIPEPYTTKKVFPDVLIVPLVGFDKNKFRLGYGGGFYDRYISRVLKFKKVLTIGFAFSFQEIKKVPINRYDQKLDFILTDKEIIK
jgi:5-formyltetrahydrofolate cyclo-ligase|tara:strand:- start:52 stop:597 length:546 start_codon:yes stop_codon:yes gene_type:complete